MKSSYQTTCILTGIKKLALVLIMDYTSFETKKKPLGDYSTSRGKIWKVVSIVGLAVGILALLASTASLTLVVIQIVHHQSENNVNVAERELKPLRTARETELLVSELLHKKHFHGHRNARSINCIDYSDEVKNKTPTAHITSTSADQEFIISPAGKLEVLSAQWACRNTKFTKAHVAGGMTFIDGFLKVPFDGVYFIYSQVASELKNYSDAQNSANRIVIGHSTMICKCSEDGQPNSCRCSTGNEDNPLSDIRNKAYMRSTSEGTGIYKGSNFHGGLFHLEANSYISIVPFVTSHSNPKTTIIGKNINSFFGAFLVSE